MKNNIESKLETVNDKLPIDSQISIMKFSEVQKYLRNCFTTNSIQGLLLRIDLVNSFDDHVEVIFKSGRKIKAFFDGHYEKYNINGKLCSKGGFGTSRGIHNGHIRINADGVGISLERLILIAVDIKANKVAISYKGLEAKFLDGSGNIDMAERLMIKPNFNPHNLKWCVKADNIKLSNMIKKR